MPTVTFRSAELANVCRLACLTLFAGVLQSLASPAAAFFLTEDDDSAIPFKLVPRFQNHVEVTDADGVMQITSTGNDPYLEFDIQQGLPDVEPADRRMRKLMTFEYFSSAGIHGIEIRVRDVGDWKPAIDAGSLIAAQGWTEGKLSLVEQGNDFWSSGRPRILRIDFGQEAGRSISLRNIQLRAPTPEELETERRLAAEWAGKLAVAEQWSQYLNSPKELALRRVQVDDEHVRISGTIPDTLAHLIDNENGSKRLVLVELEPHQSSVVLGPRRIVAELNKQSVAGSDRAFTFSLPRYLQGYDRLLSRWQLAVSADEEQDVTPEFNAIYATDLEMEIDPLTPPATLRNAKGLGGISPVFGLEELVELGIKHITVNVVITDLIQLAVHSNDGAVQSDDGAFEYAGKYWKLNTGRLHHVDQTVRFATQHDIAVAAIVLLPQRSNDAIVHPNSSSSGIYAMPNLTERDVALKYAAIMHALGKRYAGKEHGRIDHWIMHNEVDFGWIWTNMGEQPMDLFMDHYVRSMRIASLETRQFNPFSQVFISLTHHWNVPDDPRGRTYSPRRMLDWLAAANRSEGGFAWGIAHHPYPQNLFNPRTWDDPDAVDDVATKHVTMKNLQVLKNYLQQPQFLNAAGNQRSVLLSEQGYHTPDYSRESQELQSEALRYTWQRLRETDFVLAYDYHRWVDAAEEGGLLLGLRMVGDSQRTAGDKKLGWTTYRDLESNGIEQGSTPAR